MELRAYVTQDESRALPSPLFNSTALVELSSHSELSANVDQVVLHLEIEDGKSIAPRNCYNSSPFDEDVADTWSEGRQFTLRRGKCLQNERR